MRTIAEVFETRKKKKDAEAQLKLENRHRAHMLVRNAKTWLIIFANIIALTFDALAVTTVYSLTGGNYLMSALSLLPTGIPMILWELAWLNPLASKYQKDVSVSGMVVSVVSAFIVGVLAVLAVEWPSGHFLLSIALLIWCVGAVIFHGLRSAFYFYRDPIIEQEHILQTTVSEQEFQKDAIAHGKSIMEMMHDGLEQEKALRDQFGDAAVERWLALMFGDEGKQIPANSKARTGSPVPRPQFVAPTLPTDFSYKKDDAEDPS